jgi:hypothetical protein
MMRLAKQGGAMARTQTTFEALEELARDLDIGLVSGPLQPPEAGRLYLGRRSLAEIVLSTWADQPIALAIAAGGPTDEQVLTGTTTLDADALARLERAIHAAGGHVYQGRLAQLTPAKWLQRQGGPASMQSERAPSSAAYGWHDNLANAEIATLDTGPVLAAARAAGWPAVFADEPVLFLGDEPVYYLLMRENVGRNVTMLIGVLA